MLKLLRFSLIVALAAAFIPVTATAKSKAEKKRDKILEMREEVLERLFEEHPSAEARIKGSVGHAVFSNVGVNLFVVSAGGGSGVVEDANGNLTYMKMGQAGVGVGLGVKDFRGIFIFYDEDKLKNFIDKGWDFSGEADAAVKAGDKGGQMAGAANLYKGVEVIQLTENGIALQATLNGTKYWKDKDLNAL